MGQLYIFKVYVKDNEGTKLLSVHLSGILAYGAVSYYYKRRREKMRIGFNNRDIKSDDEELILINMLSGEKVQFYVEKEEFNGMLNDAREYIRNFGSNNLDVDDYFQGLK